uniref:Uncharacterized protein n=1 Tax=Glossina morsitans morsitans TaxID=37546 RepID=A0ABK9NGF7_GLOMM
MKKCPKYRLTFATLAYLVTAAILNMAMFSLLQHIFIGSKICKIIARPDVRKRQNYRMILFMLTRKQFIKATCSHESQLNEGLQKIGQTRHFIFLIIYKNQRVLFSTPSIQTLVFCEEPKLADKILPQYQVD